MAEGFVSLVGAGPGDPYLLTLAGREALEQADCVVYDRLVHPRVLDFAPPDAQRIFVGKEPGNRYTPQERINSLLVELARSGKRVVRLKGGDPLIFARGAEEIDALAEARVEYEIIPGVTAALAAAASAAIPLTHRKYSSLVTLVTGHDDPEKPLHVDWRRLAQQPGTIAVYMARSKIPAIVRDLIDGGMQPETPIAFVQWAGSNRQRVHATSLAHALAGPPTDIGTPMIAIVGSVVAERAATLWFERRPLFGQSILLLRSHRQALETARRLERLGADVLAHPVISIEEPASWEHVDRAVESLSPGDWLVFTSANGVESFLGRLWQRGFDWRSLAAVRIAAIGPRTAEALAAFHLRPDLVSPEFRSESLAEQVAPHVAGARVILARADRGRDVLARELAHVAREVVQLTVYRQRDVNRPPQSLLDTIRDGNLNWVLLTSGNVARGFFRWLDPMTADAVRKCVRLASISPVTSAVIREAGFDVAIEATQYTTDGLTDALLKSISNPR